VIAESKHAFNFRVKYGQCNINKVRGILNYGEIEKGMFTKFI